MVIRSQQLRESIAIARVIRKYQEQFGEAVLRHLEKQIGVTDRETVDDNDINSAIAAAYQELLAAKLEDPRPDPATLARSMDDLRHGRTAPIEKLIDAL